MVRCTGWPLTVGSRSGRPACKRKPGSASDLSHFEACWSQTATGTLTGWCLIWHFDVRRPLPVGRECNLRDRHIRRL